MKKIINYIKNIPEKPEETRIKMMWALIVFFMLVMICVWWIGFASNKPKINFNQSALPPFPDFSEGIDGISKLNEQKDEIAVELEIAAKQEEMEKIAKDYIRGNGLMKEEDISNLRLKNIKKQENKWHLRYQQYYKNTLVDGSGVSFEIDDAEKKVVSFESDYDPDIALDVKPKITEEEAYHSAVETLSGKELNPASSELVVYKGIGQTPVEYYLAWKMNIASLQESRDYYCFVNAENGEIILCYN